MELTETEMLKKIDDLRKEAYSVRDRLEFAEGQAYYQELDRLAEINTLIKQLQSRLEEKAIDY